MRFGVETVLIIIFLIAIIVEFFYIIPVITDADSPNAENNIFTAGITISILLILVIILLRQKEILGKLGRIEKTSPQKSTKDIKRELNGLYSDLGALKILLKDELIPMSDYKKKSDAIRDKIELKQQEFNDSKKRSSSRKKSN